MMAGAAMLGDEKPLDSLETVFASILNNVQLVRASGLQRSLRYGDQERKLQQLKSFDKNNKMYN